MRPSTLRIVKKQSLPLSQLAKNLGLGVNAGHDLSLENLAYFHQNIPGLDEVSIGHALISDALYYGLKETIRLYKEALLIKELRN